MVGQRLKINDTKCEKNSNKEKRISSEKGEDPNNLKREIGLFNAIAITVGAIIGSGIFISPKGIISHVGSVGLSLIMWVFCGCVSLLGAFCYAELGTTFPSAGGQYTYLHEAFGPILAFLSLWTNTLIFIPIGNAIFGLSFANYVTQPFFKTSADIPDSAIQLLAAVVICLLTYVNCCDIRNTRKLLNGFMILKISALCVIILGGIYVVLSGQAENYGNIWENSKFDSGNLVLASLSGSFAYGGYQAMTHMMEELKEPNKNLPRAILISLVLVTFVYLLTNASYFAVLTPQEIIFSDAVAVTFVEKFIGIWGWIVPIFVAISIFGTLGTHILTTSRFCFVGSRCGQLPSFLSLLLLSNKLPAPAAIFLCIQSVMFLFFVDVYLLIEFGAITGNFFSLLTVAALIYLRWKKPDIDRPFKISFAIPILYLLVCLLVFAIPIYVKPLTSGIGATLTLSGIPVYYLFISKDRKKYTWIQDFSGKVTRLVQKLLIAGEEDERFR